MSRSVIKFCITFSIKSFLVTVCTYFDFKFPIYFVVVATLVWTVPCRGATAGVSGVEGLRVRLSFSFGSLSLHFEIFSILRVATGEVVFFFAELWPVAGRFYAG